MRARAILAFVIAWVAAWSGDAAASAGRGAWRSLGMYPTASGAGGRGATSATLPMVDSDVDVVVRGAFVDTTVTQTFVNRSSRATEATYVFPLPADAVVTEMTIEVDGRRIVARIEERAAAQAKYEEAIRSGVMAATLEQERADVFTQTVAAVPANGRIKVTLRYDSFARYGGGAWSFVLPMVVAPRFVPGVATGQGARGSGRSPDTDRAPDASRITPGASPGGGGATNVRVTFADAVSNVASVTHDITATKGTSVYAFTDARTDHDAVVTWAWTRPVTAWIERAADGSAFAAVIVQADDAKAQPRSSLRALLIVDHAATMKGDASAVAQPFARTIFSKLSSNDRARIHGAQGTSWEKPSDAARSLELATKNAQGPFDLTRVLATARPERAPIVLITSGLVADDIAAIDAARKVGVPIHVVGVGPAPARGLLERIAAVSNGTVRYVLPSDDLDAAAKDLIASLASGGSALAINWGALAVRDMVPVVTPRLGPGQAMVAVARVAGAVPKAANVRVRGELVALTAFTVATTDGAVTTAGPLARRWAKLRLEDLLVGTRDAKTITQLALSYGLVSPYTSLVAVGEKVVVEGGVKHSVAVPVSVPAGMRWDDVRAETSAVIAPNDAADPSPATKTTTTSRPPVAQAPTTPAPRNAGAAPDSAQPSRAPVAVQGENAKEPASEEDEGSRGADHDVEDQPVSEMVTIGTTLASETGVFIQRRAWRIAAHLQGGVVRVRGETAGLFAVGARIDRAVGPRTLLGGEGSLLVVDADGADARGRGLLTASIVGVGAQFLELGVGLGAQFGAGLGPAWSGALRFHLPVLRHLSVVIRYDGATLFLDDASTTEHAVTGGLEWTF